MHCQVCTPHTYNFSNRRMAVRCLLNSFIFISSLTLCHFLYSHLSLQCGPVRATVYCPSTVHIACLFLSLILGASGSAQRKVRASKDSLASFLTGQSSWLHGNLVPSGGLPGPMLASGLPCVQVQLLQVRAMGWAVPGRQISPGPCGLPFPLHPQYPAPSASE